MKNENLLHTPEGVRDIYDAECARKVKLQDRLSKIFSQYGYRRIQTPTFEFFDIFNGERGTVTSREMYKFFDREGNTLVLRPDMTPSVARAVAKYYKDEKTPLRFCYAGNVFVNHFSYQGRMKESTQMGGELIGDDSAAADAEQIVLAIELLKEAGLDQFVVDIGHAGFLRVVMEQAGLDEESEELLKSLIENKNYFGIESLIEEKKISEDLKNILMEMPNLSGSYEILENVKKLTGNQKALAIIDRLKQIYECVSAYGLGQYITFDLGMPTGYDYYTGVIFRGYTYGTGDAIVKGGRYDNLIGQFGKDAPSVGFVVVIDQLMAALDRQKVRIDLNEPSILLLYQAQDYQKAITEATKLRKENMSVTLMERDPLLSEDDYRNFCHRFFISTLMEIQEGEICRQEVDVK